MIQRLLPEGFEKARRIFAPINYHLAIESIIRGLSRSKVFVDDPEAPRSAMTWFKHRVYLAGGSGNDPFNEALPSLITETYRRETNSNAFVLCFEPNWKGELDSILAGLRARRGLRHYYRLDASTRTWEAEPPEGFDLIPIDARLLEKTRLLRIDEVVEEMQSERLSVDDFLEKSFGYCVLHGDEIAGWCMSEYNVDNKCELGIAIVEGYRRRGLATLLGSAVIRHALGRGVNEIGWHCWGDNEPSVATALKLGFEKAAEYPVYFVKI